MNANFKADHDAKFFRQKMFAAGFISCSRDFTSHFHLQCVARSIFIGFGVHPADASILRSYGVCKLRTRAQLKLLFSLLFAHTIYSDNQLSLKTKIS